MISKSVMQVKARKNNGKRTGSKMNARYFTVKSTSFYSADIVVVVVLLFYVLGKQLKSCRDGEST